MDIRPNSGPRAFSSCTIEVNGVTGLTVRVLRPKILSRGHILHISRSLISLSPVSLPFLTLSDEVGTERSLYCQPLVLVRNQGRAPLALHALSIFSRPQCSEPDTRVAWEVLVSLQGPEFADRSFDALPACLTFCDQHKIFHRNIW